MTHPPPCVAASPQTPASDSCEALHRERRWAQVVVLVLLAETVRQGLAPPVRLQVLPSPVGFVLVALMGLYLMASARGLVFRVSRALLLFCLALFYAGEFGLALRGTGSRPAYIAMTPDNPVLGYRLVPGGRTGDDRPPISSLGCLDREYPLAKPDRGYRILICGDSVPNDGHLPWDEVFHVRLEHQLNEPPLEYGPVEVINFSVEGYNTLQEVERLREGGVALRPDLVIVPYVLNDPYPEIALNFTGSGSFSVLSWSLVGSYLAHEVFDIATPSVIARLYDGECFDFVVRQGMDRLQDLAALHGFEVLVFCVPYIQNFEHHAFHPYYERVRHLARARDFHTLDLFELFRQAGAETLAKDRYDPTHPNARGHQIMADALDEFLAPKVRARRSAASDRQR